MRELAIIVTALAALLVAVGAIDAASGDVVQAIVAEGAAFVGFGLALVLVRDVRRRRR